MNVHILYVRTYIASVSHACFILCISTEQITEVDLKIKLALQCNKNQSQFMQRMKMSHPDAFKIPLVSLNNYLTSHLTLVPLNNHDRRASPAVQQAGPATPDTTCSVHCPFKVKAAPSEREQLCDNVLCASLFKNY